MQRDCRKPALTEEECGRGRRDHVMDRTRASEEDQDHGSQKEAGWGGYVKI